MQMGFSAALIYLSALATSFAFRSVPTTQALEGGVSCIATSMHDDQCRCHCARGSSGKRERLAD